jgi:predicted DNA-binding protein (MmcQ/YjbR family)
MGLSLKEQISSFIRSLPNVEQKHDPMSEEAYFYGLRNFAHFHGLQHIDIRLSKPQQEEALRTHMAIQHRYAPQAGWVSCILETEDDVANTKRLIKQAYDTCVSLKTLHRPAN